jgi:hypothetical protein
MLLTFVTGSDAGRKLYATRCASVVCYFSENDDGGVVLNTEQGSGTWPSVFEAVANDVRAAVLAMVAARLKVTVADVLNCKFADLVKVADPDLPPEYRFARPSNRAYPRRFG